ncbi:MAG: hypothetical protein LBR00_02520, partial [Clostridiales Family XIII bacterium]|nr:hypothetical protein [Clostridiales Family XIII bacterium]
MLNVYYGREDVDKLRFLFARIKEETARRGHDGRVLLIVPDQFTLEAERAAFDYLDVPAFVNPVVLSMNRLAGRVLDETGGRTEFIDQYGKYMLLARLLHRGRDELAVYRRLENSPAFIEKLSAAIMSFKTHLVSPADLEEGIIKLESDSLLRRKLLDLLFLYRGYEDALAKGGLPDSTDVTRRFVSRIADSRMLAGACVWVYGYDYISPLYIEAIAQMAAVCEEVSVVLTAEPANAFFAMTNGTAEALCEAARKAGAEVCLAGLGDICRGGILPPEQRSGDCPAVLRPPEIMHIEKYLFAFGLDEKQTVFTAGGRLKAAPTNMETGSPEIYRGGILPPALVLHKAADFDAEAAAAARAIASLVRNEGLRYRDILVLCNDPGRRSSAIKRVFDAAGLPTFFDRRRDVDHNPVLEYILALPEIQSRGRRSEDIFRWIRTGLVPLEEEDAEELENYALRYGLRGTAWGRPLRRGAAAYEEEMFARLGAAAAKVAEILDAFRARFTESRTAEGRTRGLRRFLAEDAGLPAMVERLADALEADGFEDYAAEMRGIIEVTDGI